MDYSKLISVVQIEGIRVIDGVMRTKISSADDSMSAELGHNVKLAHPPIDGRLAYRAAFRFVVRPTSQDSPANTPPDDYVLVRAMFEVTYQIPSDVGSAPSSEVLEEFGRVNVLFNAWPYWREWLHQALGRMALPPIILPVMRVPAPSRDKADTPAV